MAIERTSDRHGRSTPLGLTVVLVVSLAMGFVVTTGARPAEAAVGPVAGTTWMTNGKVNDVVRIGNTIYLGGVFTQLKSKPSGGTVITVKNLAAIDATTGQGIATWTPDTAVPNRSGEVFALAVAPDGSRVYAGGDFTTVNGVSAKRIVALDPDDGDVIPGFTPNVNWKVRALHAIGSTVYLGGDFATVNSQTRTRLAAVDTAGALLPWSPIVDPTNTAWNGRITGIATSAAGTMVYVVGDFRGISGGGGSTCARRSIAAVHPITGACITTWNTPNTDGTMTYGGQHFFDVIATPTVVYGAMGGAANYVGHYSPTTGQQFGKTNADGDPQALALVGCAPATPAACNAANDLYVGGHFDVIHGLTRTRVALIRVTLGSNTTSTVVDPWAPSVNSYYGVWSLHVNQDGSQLALGGQFTWVSGAAHNYFALFSAPDQNPPTVPQNLEADATSADVTLTWDASSDTGGVAGYEVRKDGASLGELGPATTFVDNSVVVGETYTYEVRARDGNNNHSDWSAPLDVTIPAGVLFQDGFETGDLSRWTGHTSLMTVGTNPVFAGSFAARATSSGPVANAYKTLSSPVDQVSFSFRFQLISKGANKVAIGRLATAGNAGIVTVLISTNGNLAFRNNATGTVDTTSPVPVTMGTWHELTTDLDVATGQIQVRLDGTLVNALSVTQDFGTTAVGRVTIGEVAGARVYDLAFDDALVA